jgi:hypothetical protein
MPTDLHFCFALPFMETLKMSNPVIAPINTRLQPGGASVRAGEPFQRLAGKGKTVETVMIFFVSHHRAEARC